MCPKAIGPSLPRMLGERNSHTVKLELNQVKFHSKVLYLNMHIKSKYKYKIMQSEIIETWHCNVSLKFHTNTNDKNKHHILCLKLYYNNTHN
jgi:hypothetical protein